MSLRLFLTRSNVEEDHGLEFAIVDINPTLLATLIRRCEFMRGALEHDELVSEIRYWDHQSCEYYSYKVIEGLLEKLPGTGFRIPTDLLNVEESIEIPFRPASPPEWVDCREMCIAPDIRDGDHFIRWRAFPRHSDTIILTPELRLSELREIVNP